jgi:hypothetical protein
LVAEKVNDLEVSLYNKEQEMAGLQEQVDNTQHLEEQLEELVQKNLDLEEVRNFSIQFLKSITCHVSEKRFFDRTHKRTHGIDEYV